jgi:hypothetical protein
MWKVFLLNTRLISRRAGFAVLVSCLCWLGCSKEEPIISTCNPENFFPLASGNYWIYRNYKEYADGRIDSGGIDSMFISNDTLMLGYRFFHLEGSFHNKPVSYFLTSADGRIISADRYVFYQCPRLFNSNKLYPVMGFDFPAILNTSRLDSLIRVPAGDFEPVMLFQANSMLEDTILIVTYKAYFARKTGIVKFSAMPEPTRPYVSYSELVRFHLSD